LRKPTGAVEKTALDWNPQDARRYGRPRKTWRNTVEEEAREAGETWNQVKRLHWIGTLRMLVDVGVPGKLGGTQWRRKSEKQAKHGTK
jgi:hypothetical protein